MSILSHIWQPLDIGPVTVKNRVLVPARTVLWATDDHVLSERHLAHFRELAQGGAALIITEQHGAHPISTGSFHRPCTAFDKRAIPGFAAFAETVHESGAKGFVQLFTPGIHDKGTMIVDDWHPLWGASRIPSFVHGETPMEMGKDQIRELVCGFGESAANVRAGGLDGVEIHAGHGYMPGQFLSPMYNVRTDEYGGSVQNRCRVIVEIGQAIRERVGGELALGVRLSFDEFLGPSGITPEDAEEQLDLLAATGLFDYFSISAGTYLTLSMTSAPMGIEDGHLLPYARRAKRIVGDRAKVMGVGRVRDLHLVEQALTNGDADMVAMGRAHFADPHLVKKTQEGREREIIRCTGVNECVGRLFDNQEVICMMNPVTGRERTWGPGTLTSVNGDKKKVVVVGGGPAGMKVAEVAARRGHDVVLMERDAALGGHFNLISRFPGRDGWEVAADNLRRAVENAGVTTRLGIEADRAAIAAEQPDVVVIATGATYDTSGLSAYRPDRPGIPGVDGDDVFDLKTACLRALDDPQSLGAKVVILDESASYLPLALAELLAGGGVEVEVVTPQMFVGADTQRHLELPLIYPRLKKAGVRLSAQQSIERIDGPSVTVHDIWGGEVRVLDDVSAVVLSVYRQPNEQLFREIEGAFGEVHRIGDCLAPRKPGAVIYEGEKLGREI